MAMFDDTSALAACMEKQLALKECQLEDGSTVTNLEGICQAFIGRALDGDLQAADFIARITGKKK
jgi:hypothetical protein